MRFSAHHGVTIILVGLFSVSQAQYCPPSSPQSDGMRDIMLIYAQPGKWTEEDFRPYVAYLDRTGKPCDWFFDAWLFLMYGGAPSGQTYIAGTTNKKDWEFFISEEFAPGRELAALDATIDEVAKQMGVQALIAPVIVMIPYPSKMQKDFGDVDGDGMSENFSTDDGRQKAIAWFLREFITRWQNTPRKHLKLWGFYWMNEGIGPGDEPVVKWTSREIHRLGYKFHWIPWFNAPGVEKWGELGFDLVIMQPNYAFIRGAPFRIFDENRLTEAANQCRRLGMGIEMELNEALFSDPAYRINLQLYLDHGDEFLDGYQAGAVRAYYQGHDTIARLCRSDQPALRQLYDDLYAFHKGTYKRRRPYQPLPTPTSTHGEAACLVDGLWNTRVEASAPTLALGGSRASVSFDFGGERLVGDVRVHFPATSSPPTTAIQRISLILDNSTEVASVDDVSIPPEHGGFAILHFAPRIARQMRLDFAIKEGERIAVDEVLLMPTPHLLWGSPYEITGDAKEEAGCLTDGVIGGQKFALWPSGKGGIRFRLKEMWYAKSLLVHFCRVNKNSFSPKVILDTVVAAPSHLSDGGMATIPMHRPIQQIALTIEDAGQVGVDEIMLLPEENLARGCPYTLDPPFKAKYPDTDGRALTDGEVSTRGFGDGKTVGWSNWNGVSVVNIMLDTGDVREIDSVEVHVQGGTYGAVHFPKRVAVLVSEDSKNWIKVAESQSEPQEVVTLKMGDHKCLLGWLKIRLHEVRGRYVRVRFTPDAWLMVSEIRIFSNGQNVALGRPYTLSPQPTSDEKYADNTDKLTDGYYSGPGAGWNACVGYSKTDPKITVDLGAPRRIYMARVHLVGGGSGGVYFPKEVSVETSLDGNTWRPVGVCTERPPETCVSGTTGFMGVTFAPHEARFVRFYLKCHGWAMPDEIEIFPPPPQSR